MPTSQPADTPAWTDSNTHDPGVTLAGLFGFLSESSLYRAELIPHGTAEGLSLVQAPSEPPTLKLSPGLAIDPTGRSLVPDLPAVASKFIGETEKHVGAVLRDATPAAALLHCDDVQALFGKDD